MSASNKNYKNWLESFRLSYEIPSPCLIRQQWQRAEDYQTQAQENGIRLSYKQLGWIMGKELRYRYAEALRLTGREAIW